MSLWVVSEILNAIAKQLTRCLQLPKRTKSPCQRALDVFLPAGYPHSVTDDYLE